MNNEEQRAEFLEHVDERRTNNFDWMNSGPIKTLDNQSCLLEFRKSLFYEKEEEVKQFLLKCDINKPENDLGCVSSTLWFIVSVANYSLCNPEKQYLFVLETTPI
jgi:hypothetical protein